MKLKIASEFLKANTLEDGTSKYSKKKSGEILFARHPDIFKNAEDARRNIRQVTGAVGKKSNSRHKQEYNVEWKGVSLPKPEKNDYSKVVIKEKRIGILSDIHFPYYDEDALNASIKFLIKWKPDCIILNGDIIDCYHLSNFEKDKRERSFKYELDMLRNFFIELRSLFPKVSIIYKVANHEERYEKQLLNRLPELLELELFSFENVIEATKHNIQVVKNKRVIRAGKLNIIHAHELPKGMAGPVNPARGFYMKTKASTIGGHHHQSSEHIEKDLNDNIIGCWSTGCLCELAPKYSPINKWNHGFCTVEVLDNEGNFKVNNIKIINGKVM